jgi:hypothetical protein
MRAMEREAAVAGAEALEEASGGRVGEGAVEERVRAEEGERAGGAAMAAAR